MLCSVVITDGFQKINPHLEAKQATAVFAWRDEKTHETSEMHYIVKNQ